MSSRRPTSAPEIEGSVQDAPAHVEEESVETPASLREKQVRMEQQVYRIWTYVFFIRPDLNNLNNYPSGYCQPLKNPVLHAYPTCYGKSVMERILMPSEWPRNSFCTSKSFLGRLMTLNFILRR